MLLGRIGRPNLTILNIFHCLLVVSLVTYMGFLLANHDRGLQMDVDDDQ